MQHCQIKSLKLVLNGWYTGDGLRIHISQMSSTTCNAEENLLVALRIQPGNSLILVPYSVQGLTVMAF
jgi:hypothetical protein